MTCVTHCPSVASSSGSAHAVTLAESKSMPAPSFPEPATAQTKPPKAKKTKAGFVARTLNRWVHAGLKGRPPFDPKANLKAIETLGGRMLRLDAKRGTELKASSKKKAREFVEVRVEDVARVMAAAGAKYVDITCKGETHRGLAFDGVIPDDVRASLEHLGVLGYDREDTEWQDISCDGKTYLLPSDTIATLNEQRAFRRGRFDEKKVGLSVLTESVQQKSDHTIVLTGGAMGYKEGRTMCGEALRLTLLGWNVVICDDKHKLTAEKQKKAVKQRELLVKYLEKAHKQDLSKVVWKGTCHGAFVSAHMAVATGGYFIGDQIPREFSYVASRTHTHRSVRRLVRPLIRSAFSAAGVDADVRPDLQKIDAKRVCLIDNKADTVLKRAHTEELIELLGEQARVVEMNKEQDARFGHAAGWWKVADSKRGVSQWLYEINHGQGAVLPLTVR